MNPKRPNPFHQSHHLRYRFKISRRLEVVVELLELAGGGLELLGGALQLLDDVVEGVVGLLAEGGALVVGVGAAAVAVAAAGAVVLDVDEEGLLEPALLLGDDGDLALQLLLEAGALLLVLRVEQRETEDGQGAKADHSGDASVLRR